MRVGWLACLVLTGCALPAPAAPGPPPFENEGPGEKGAFITLLGNDTVSIESYVRTPTRLRVHAFTRSPETRIVDFLVTWSEAGRLQGYELRSTGVPRSGAQAPIHAIATVVGDSVEIATTQGTSAPRIRRTASGPDVPLLTPSYALFETAIMRARATRPDTLWMLPSGGPAGYAARWTANGVTLSNAGGPIHIVTDAEGRIRELSGAETTHKVDVRPVTPVNVDTLAATFATRPLGPTLSPRDTARAVVGDATILIDYGRPLARGRIIWGGVVPWDAVWRTGANAATQLEITHGIAIGNVGVPAGKYSLWTIPSRSQEWLLVINRQTGQWGTVYDAAQDVARIPIRTQRVRDAAERFTIEIEARGREGVIKLTWANTQALVPFTVR